MNCPVSRNEIMQKMLDDGISTRRGIMTTHRETAYKTECAGLSLPVSENSSDRSIILPLYIPMKDEDIEKVIEAFRIYVGATCNNIIGKPKLPEAVLLIYKQKVTLIFAIISAFFICSTGM